MTHAARNLSRGEVWGFAATLAAAVLLALIIVPSLAAESKKGKIISAGNAKVTIQDLDGKSHTFAVTKDAKITRDGKAAKLEQLVKGDSATVTTELKESEVFASAIDAVSQKSAVAAGPETASLLAGPHNGTVVSAGQGKLKIRGEDGKTEKSFDVAADAKITRDGKAAKLEDLMKDDSVKVTTELKGTKEVATVIEGKGSKKKE